MNRSEAKANADVMLAFANGQAIQFRVRRRASSNPYDPVPTWKDLSGPDATLSFHFSTFEYRVKPEPQQGYINVYGDIESFGCDGDRPRVGGFYTSLLQARSLCGALNRGDVKGRTFKIVEVLPE